MKGIDPYVLNRMQDHFMLMEHDNVEPEIVKESGVLPFEAQPPHSRDFSRE